MTISVGWWALPTVITLAAFAVAFWRIPAPQPSSYFPDTGPVIQGFIYFALATIASLAAWLMWALFGGAA